MEPKYLSFRFGDSTPLAHHPLTDKVSNRMPRDRYRHVHISKHGEYEGLRLFHGSVQRNGQPSLFWMFV